MIDMEEASSDLPDVTHLLGSESDRDAQAAFEHYRTAFDLALYAPSVSTFREAVLAHDKLMGIIKGANDGAYSQHQT